MRIRQFQVEGLGHLSALIADEATGAAAIVDPRRDVDIYLDALAVDGLRLTHVVETHLHNDYVSGGRELATLTGATHVIGAGAALAHEHRGVVHGERFDVGQLAITALHTPGHTPEHTAYAVADASRADEPALLFSGGSLLVGAVGRTDLLGAANAIPWARDQYRSLRDVILAHEDSVVVLPTHGAGSLCSTGIASSPFTTVGYERRHNAMVAPVLGVGDPELFVTRLLADQPTFPRYFARMRPTNQAGPALLGGRVPVPRPMSVPEVRMAIGGGAQLVDARPAPAFAAAHVPGSLSVPAGSSFGTWLGWVADPDRPVVLLLDGPGDWDGLVRQALRIGYDRVSGYLQGGFGRWASETGEMASLHALTVLELARRLAAGGERSPLVIDVRQAGEYEAGHVPGAAHLGAGDLADRLAGLPRDRPLAAVCASGYRAAVAASILARGGFGDVAWVSEGMDAWLAAGLPVEHGTRREDAAAEHPARLAPHADDSPHGHP